MQYDHDKQRRRMASVYIGVVGPEEENGVCRDTIENINRRINDTRPIYIRATKGYDARQSHIERFLESKHGAILLLDHDMRFEADTLERLRSHGLPYVSGFYMRRMYQPIAPVWYENTPLGLWPQKPFLDNPQRGILHELGASGWGCVLVHREVFEAMGKILKGENYVIEDDMDIWPYDLDKVMTSIKTLDKMTRSKAQNKNAQIKEAVAALKDEFKPLTANNDVIGSDIRFPYYAKAAGYQLYGDPDVRSGHNLNYPLHPDDYAVGAPEQEKMVRELEEHVAKGREEHQQRLDELK
jgi:hypothetical protein